jgi:CDGSH-type Zn-finger protein
MADVTVTIIDNGPIKIEGPVMLLDENDKPIEFDAAEPMWLCRCAHSKEKPFCDGTHDKCGFVHKASS